MENGVLLAPGGRGVYWLPGGGPSEKGPCHPLRRREKRGIALGRVFLMGFFTQDPPITYYCRSCRTLFTLLEGEPPLDEWENKRPGTCPGAYFPARPELYFVFLEEAFLSWAACAWAFSAISLTPMPLRSAPSWA